MIVALAVLVLPTVAAAGEPPNQNDPCAKNGRNTCGTGGAGRYITYRYGPRWFGDYRRAVPGVSSPTFCIDLRYWYPGRSYGYKPRSADGLRNRDGREIPASSLRRMNAALWKYGGSNDPDQQGAVMLYVHRLMGDGAPGEVDPSVLTAKGRSWYSRVTSFAARFNDPVRVRLTSASKPVVGRRSTLTVSVRTSSGVPVDGITVALSAGGGGTLPARVTTGRNGIATAAYVPATTAALKVTATARSLPAESPRLYVPTNTSGGAGGAARSGQRLVAARPVDRTATLTLDAVVQPTVDTQVSDAVVTPGASLTDKVLVGGLQGRTATVQAALYGPFPTRDAINCDAAPVWSGSFEATGDGTYVTEPVVVTTPGYYTYRESIADAPGVKGVVTACGDAAETTIVRGDPQVRTQVSAARSAPGTQLTDSVVVSGLGALQATVDVALYGPFPSADQIRCDGTPVWSGSVTANGDGSYQTQPAVLPAAGYYTYVETLAESEAYPASQGRCGEASETTLAKAAPVVVTKASAAVVRPHAAIADTLTVSGLGSTPVTIKVELFGPFTSRAAISCQGRPRATTTVTAGGDGTYRTRRLKTGRAGFYMFRERIAGSELVTAAAGRCSEEAETSLAQPLIQTGRTARARLPRPLQSAPADPDGLTEPPAPTPEPAPAPPAQSTKPTGPDARRHTGAAPVRVEIRALGVRGPLVATTINGGGYLNVPKDIKQGAWWRDGAAPADRQGTVLVAGHIDNAQLGAGIFYNLRRARPGRRVALRAGGKTFTYRISRLVTMRKDRLPGWVFAGRSGPRRLVLVSCGGPFDTTTGHYRDNVIAVAVPVR